jgi:hypothetical protein
MFWVLPARGFVSWFVYALGKNTSAMNLVQKLDKLPPNDRDNNQLTLLTLGPCFDVTLKLLLFCLHHSLRTSLYTGSKS